MLRGISIFILAAAAVTASSAFAQPATPNAQATQSHAHHHGGRFAALDHNGDGYLDKSEVSGKLAENFDKIDTNHDGKLSRDELRAAWKAHRGGHHHGHHGHHMGLAKLDTDHDGRVSFAEFTAAMKAHFDRLDTNHDGYIDSSEMAARHKHAGHGGHGTWGKSKDAASASQGAAPTSK